VHVSDPNDDSIPVLHEILVPGHPVGSRPSPSGAAAPATQPLHEPDAPREPSFKVEPVLAPRPVHEIEPTLAPKPEHAADPTLAPEPVHADELALAPESLLTAEPTLAPEPVHVPAPVLTPEPLPHAYDATLAASAGVFDRAEPVTPIEAGEIVPPDFAHNIHPVPVSPQPALDAEIIAERLRGRFAGFLTGEGRGIIEARCRDALQEHSTWLVGQITREVALTLETELAGWVKDAVEEEIARRSRSA
jgi:Protein of unknown function (DUF2486)